MREEYGCYEGDVCNRNGCSGIIDSHLEGCSCHINAPCSYCVGEGSFCPVCGWRYVKKPIMSTIYNLFEWQEAEHEIRKNKINSPGPVDELVYIRKGSTNFSQTFIGKAPLPFDRSAIEAKLKGSFGGRFNWIKENGEFEYEARTD